MSPITLFVDIAFGFRLVNLCLEARELGCQNLKTEKLKTLDLVLVRCCVHVCVWSKENKKKQKKREEPHYIPPFQSLFKKGGEFQKRRGKRKNGKRKKEKEQTVPTTITITKQQ